MQPIEKQKVQQLINEFVNEDVYIHVETTNGAYSTHVDEKFFNASAFLRNIKIRYERGKIAGEGPYRVGLKIDAGWVYGEGLTHYELDDQGRLLMCGINHDDKLAIAFEISRTPFD